MFDFIGLAYQGKDIVFIFIIEYSSSMDFGPYAIGLFWYENFWKMIFWLVLKLEISYRVMISWRILVSSFRRLVGTCGFVALSRPGPLVVFILLAYCFVGFPLQHTQPGPPAVFIPIARYFLALSPGPTPRLHLWYIGRPLLHLPLPPPPPTSGLVGLDLAGIQNQVWLIAGPCFC
jgi:hypothetical protein